MNLDPIKNRASTWKGALFVALALTASAAPSNDPSTPPADSLDTHGYASFKIVAERNIFNASRSPRGTRPDTSGQKPSRVDQLTLVGTMIYEKGPHAFFDGSTREFQTVLETGKTVAGLTIREITGAQVTLETSRGTMQLRVGMQLRREEGGDWQLVASAEPAAIAAASSNPSSAESVDSAGEVSDIIKRLMQQREQELK